MPLKSIYNDFKNKSICKPLQYVSKLFFFFLICRSSCLSIGEYLLLMFFLGYYLFVVPLGRWFRTDALGWASIEAVLPALSLGAMGHVPLKNLAIMCLLWPNGRPNTYGHNILRNNVKTQVCSVTAWHESKYRTHTRLQTVTHTNVCYNIDEISSYSSVPLDMCIMYVYVSGKYFEERCSNVTILNLADMHCYRSFVSVKWYRKYCCIWRFYNSYWYTFC